MGRPTSRLNNAAAAIPSPDVGISSCSDPVDGLLATEIKRVESVGCSAPLAMRSEVTSCSVKTGFLYGLGIS